MSKEWTGSVHVAAPVEQVYAYLADFTRHAEWDEATERVEHLEGEGVGAKYRAYERLDSLMRVGDGEGVFKNQAGVAHREVTSLVPHSHIEWHTYPVPRLGISADCAFDLAAEGSGTKVTQTVRINTPSVVDALEKVVFRNMDAKQQAQWTKNLENLKAAVERDAPVREPALTDH